MRPATTLYQHNLTGILETAVRATNAQYDNAEILKRLDVRLLEVTCVFGWGGVVTQVFSMAPPFHICVLLAAGVSW